MQEEKLKQLELLISQTAARMQAMQQQLTAARQKIRQQEDTIARLRESENDLKALREWKKNTLSVLKKLETRLDKEISKVQQKQDQII